MSNFATGITVAITNRHENFVGVTINTFSSLSLEPKLVLFNLKKNSFCYGDFINCKNFAVNILSETQNEISQLFTQEIKNNKWESIKLSSHRSTFPHFKDSLSYLECRKHKVYDGGDHSIIIGEVLDIKNINDGKRPLIYYGREYRNLDI